MSTAVSAAPRPRPKPRLGPRPRLLRLTPKLRQTLLEQIADGVPLKTSALANGIPERTFHEWMAKGRLEDAVEPYRSFALEVDEAQEAWAARAVQRIDAAGDKDYRALTWLLERKRPAEWGDPNRGGVTVNVGVIVESPEWRALSARLLEVLAPFPDALDAVLCELGGGSVVEGEAGEVAELAA